jgi:hypothetical protein
MKNKKSSKIGLTFLGFFYNFLRISKVLLKRKKKRFQQYWADSSPDGPATQGKRGAPAPAMETSQKGPRGFG